MRLISKIEKLLQNLSIGLQILTKPLLPITNIYRQKNFNVTILDTNTTKTWSISTHLFRGFIKNGCNRTQFCAVSHSCEIYT